jgi:hypothetical protein
MPKKFLGLLVGALVLIVPASASAVVSVRAESGSPNALLSSIVTPTNGQVSGDGGVFSCAGTGTAAGALNAATAGNWAGEEFFGDIQVGRITSVDFTTESTADYYWSFNVNEAPASAGICASSVGDGDRILFYKACNVAVTGCYAGAILRVSGPASATPGTPVTFTVEQVTTAFGGPPDFLPTTTRVPANGVTVQAGGSTVVTGADGTASFALPAGPHAVRATRSNDVPGQSDVCVTSGSDNACTPVELRSKLLKSIPAFSSIKNGKRYSRKNAPREIKGSVKPGRAGIKEVRVRLARTIGERCASFGADAGKFETERRCGVKHAPFFAVGTGSEFSYLLPGRLGRGNYVLDVRVVDKDGSQTKSFVNGATRVKFKVK